MKNVVATHNSRKMRLLLLPIAIPLWLVGWALCWIGFKSSPPKRVFARARTPPPKPIEEITTEIEKKKEEPRAEEPAQLIS